MQSDAKHRVWVYSCSTLQLCGPKIYPKTGFLVVATVAISALATLFTIYMRPGILNGTGDRCSGSRRDGGERARRALPLSTAAIGPDLRGALCGKSNGATA
jgi:hypothetical protein